MLLHLVSKAAGNRISPVESELQPVQTGLELPLLSLLYRNIYPSQQKSTSCNHLYLIRVVPESVPVVTGREAGIQPGLVTSPSLFGL